MTPPIPSEAGLALELVATGLVRGAALVATAWLATRFVASANARRTAWIALFAALAATPLLVLRPGWVSLGVGDAPAPVAAAGGDFVAGPSAAFAPGGADDPVRPPGAETTPFEAVVPDATAGGSFPLARIVLLAWLAGTFLLLARMVAARRALSAVASSGRDPGARLAAAARDEAARLGLDRPVRVILADDLAVPASWGDRRPVVALPGDADRWSDERVRVVLRHELVHVRRRDALVLALARGIRALYWPNPLVWWAVRRVREAQEEACDELVLASGVPGPEYARHLVDVARACARPGPRLPEPALTIGARERLERRVRSILAGRPAESRRGLAALVAAALVLLAAPLSGVRVEPLRDRIVDTALERFESTDTAERRLAARQLATMPDGRARRILEAGLRDRDPVVRRAAATGLARLAEPTSVHPLLAALGDDERSVREAAIVALGSLAPRRAFYDLKPIAVAGDPYLSAPAIWALGRIRCFPGIGVLGEVLAESPAARDRATAARALRGAPAALAAGPLAAALARDPDPVVRREAADALGGLAFGEDAFRRALSHEAATTRRRDAHLADENDPRVALAALRDARRDPDPRVRAAVARSLDTLSSNPSS